MWNDGLWYIICDRLECLHFLTWPFRRLRCLWLGHSSVDFIYYAPTETFQSGRQVPVPVKNGYTVETCRNCGARRQFDN